MTITAEHDTLTGREHDVLRGVGRGRTDAEIAAALNIPEPTVRRHVDDILTKLGLRDRAAAIVYAFDHRVVVPGAPPTGPRLRFEALGPLRAWRDGHRVDLGPVRQQALLAALLLRADVTVSQQELLSDVWDFEQPAGNVAPVYVYRLRRCLRLDDAPPVIASDPTGYRFVGSRVELDVTGWEELLTEARTAERAGDGTAAVDAYTRALNLCHGEPLAGLPGPFAAGQRLRLAERRTTATLAKLDWQVRLGRHEEAIGELSALTHQHPYHESAAALLMRALHAAGRQADALLTYTKARNRLVTDLGVEPGRELRQAHRSVLRPTAA